MAISPAVVPQDATAPPCGEDVEPHGYGLPWAVQGEPLERTALLSPVEGAARLRDEPLATTLSRRSGRDLAELLAEATSNGDLEETDRLLRSGAHPLESPAVGRHKGICALDVAARGSRPVALLRLLLEWTGAPHPDAGCTAIFEPAVAAGIQSALWAWSNGFGTTPEYDQEVRTKLWLLVEWRADPNTRVEHTCETPLHSLARQYDTQRAKQAPGAGPSEWKKSRAQSARLKYGLLLQMRADPELRSRKNETPLDLVRFAYRVELPKPGDAVC